MGEDADPSIYAHQIKDAKKGLLKCRKQFPDILKCFVEEDNIIFLRCSPYLIFEERLMYKTGLILPEAEYSIEIAE
jgi:hypothetical protein